VTAAAAAARASARASRDELDVLRTAGVLDAGALGLVLVLDALVVAAAGAAGAGGPALGDPDAGGVSVVRGSMDAVTLDQLLDAGALPRVPGAGDALSSAPGGEAEPHGAGSGALELMFVLTGPAGEQADTVAAGLRGALAEVGDSVVVVGGDAGTGTAVWQAHVHTDHLDRALAIAADAARTGTLAQVHVRHLAAAGQHEWGVVAATSAPGLAGELAHAGAVVLLTGGVGATVEDLVADDVERAAASTGARRVLLLGAPGVTAGTGALDVDELITVPSATDVHAVVALAALGTLLPVGLPDQAGDPVDAHAVVGEALAGLTVHDTSAAAAVDVLEQAAGPGTIVVTALLDAGVPGDLADGLAAALGGCAPDAELVVLSTGRPGDGVHLGAETVAPEPEVDA
ncbi:Dak phosphatase, partial [Promicromonospora sp. MEB111]|uniref:Dak phosphatase n=1 Tax=Promicromonospora sp. MEB111 TaxID=3040301 RepID=UPI00254A51BA